MNRTRISHFLAIAVAILLAGCAAGKNFQSAGPQPGEITLAVTDTPPSGLTFLAAQVTVTKAVLNPGNVSVLAAPQTIELTRLQTDTGLLSVSSAPAGTYSSMTLTFSNLTLTLENDTGSNLMIGGLTCPPGPNSFCSGFPTATNLSSTFAVPSFTLASGGGAGLLIDVNLNNLFSSSLTADFQNGVTISQLTPSGGNVLAAAEDVSGQVTTVGAAQSTFTLQSGTHNYLLTADNTTAFINFPSNLCTTPSMACVQAGEMLNVDISLETSGILVAKNVILEDATSSEPEIEGVIVSLNSGTRQITIIPLMESPSVSGVSIGSLIAVQYSGVTTFDIDFSPASTTGFSFASPADLLLGQGVQVRCASIPPGTINVDRVRLRASRLTANVQSVAAGTITLNNLPSLFSTHGISLIQARTSSATIFAGKATGITQIFLNDSLSVRGPLFANLGSPTLTSTKVIKH